MSKVLSAPPCLLRQMRRLSLACWLLMPGLVADAGRMPQPLQYGLDIQTTSWMVYGSVFECRFEQPIPGYGSGIFVQRAGEDVSFRLEAVKNTMDYSRAQVSLLPPPWRPSERSENLGTAQLNREPPLLSLDSRRSNVFIHGLLEGKRPTISHKTYYDENRYVRVFLSSVTFQDYYPLFVQCVNQLLPMNFDQVSRRKVFFASGEDRIDRADQKVLDQIIYYIQNDPRVYAVYLDGHSDSIGRRYDNRQISKRRVEDVERYMLEAGVDPAMLTTRFHGDRYPVASNATVSGRNENRRVTIRLEMDEDMPIPEDLLFVASPTRN